MNNINKQDNNVNDDADDSKSARYLLLAQIQAKY